MSLFRLSLANLKFSPLTTAVNILLLALGTASIAILLIATYQLQSTLTRDSADIDLVVGAKGSPLQLVLAGVYHADVPPGNISLSAAAPWMSHDMVETAIPLALGDNYLGYRIVGTEHEYVDIYGGTVASGQLWQQPLEIIVGATVAAETGLGVGSSFVGTHGLDASGHNHEQDQYTVVGVLAPTQTVLDRLLVTSMESVWQLHDSGHDDHEAHDDHDEHDEEHTEHDHEEHAEDDHEEHAEHDHEAHAEDDHEEHGLDNLDQEATVILIKYATPLAALNLPRDINAESELQAASPAFEVTRLLQIVGIGIGWLQAFAGILLISAALSIFAALYASLKARRHDLAVMRCLGASRFELFSLLLGEGMLLTLAGIVLGLAVAHGGVEIIGTWLAANQNIALTGMVWAPEESYLVIGLLMVGLLTAVIPAWQAFSTDVARTLSKP